MDNENQILVLRDNAKSDLLQIKTVEDGLTHLNKLKSIETWVKAEKKDAELQNIIAEQKLRTQRVLGELLKVAEKNKGQLLRGTQQAPREEVETLSEIGLSKKQSSTFQQIASIPEEKFEEFIAEKKEAVNNAVAELTTTGAVKLAKSLEDKRGDMNTARDIGLKNAYEKEVVDILKKINALPVLYRLKIKQGIK